MRTLLIEDEDHKAGALLTRLSIATGGSSLPCVVGGVRQAVMAVIKDSYDLIILDMALPTFSSGDEGVSSGGTDQSAGGIEILRTLKEIGRKTNIIIVTQYPDIIFKGNRVKIHQVPKLLSKAYDQNVIGAVIYSHDTSEWGDVFDALVRDGK